MIILIVLGVLTLIGFAIMGFTDNYDDAHFAGGLVATIAGVILLLALVAIPLTKLEIHAGIQQVEAVRLTVEAARENGATLESAAIQIKVAEMNEWIARIQYYRTTVFDIWYPTEIDALKPIR